MTIGACAEAGPTKVKAATDAAASISLRMFPPASFFAEREQPGPEACMPAAPLQRSRPECHCPLAGANSIDFAALQNGAFVLSSAL
jgi:hypothetical protein